MSLFDSFKVAASAMRAQSQRLNATASNMANAGTVSATQDDTYKAKRVVFEAVLEKKRGMNKANAAVQVRAKEVLNDKIDPKKIYNPQHQLADAQGYVYMPDINPAQEMVDMVEASRSYQTNAEVMNTTKNLMIKTLNLGNN
ncbi:flagellar basal body rod protein FlgC [Limnobacter humi]|uniref:Flagellar basal-body rod protein FlgC n=1 Tax=Limnobacter humi TaxID=1778671 RepID=A0ABT1WJ45_9BURK|nr:flagellar basal body rod protein FlgC [Limnobacter humi]MCQ8897540.1 flagellar basal body rod protein FlgC [Limnobacter humi]